MEKVLVLEQILTKDDCIIQTFSFNKRNKYSKFLRDSRYELYDKFERKIRERVLSVPGSITAISRKDFDDRIEIIYKKETDITITKQTFITFASEIPISPGCKFCKFLIEEGEFYKCDFKNRRMVGLQKTCKFFKQKNEQKNR